MNDILRDFDKKNETSKNMVADDLSRLEKENMDLRKKIGELQWELAGKEVELEKAAPTSDSSVDIKWYENRHNSDCIQINRLQTTIDVLTSKIVALRQLAGLE